MSILDVFKTGIRQPILLDERLANLEKCIMTDIDNYLASPDRKIYSMSSYALTFTFCRKKILKLYDLDVNICDPDLLHKKVNTTLKQYSNKCIKNISCILYVDFSETGKYHLHGFGHCEKRNIIKLLNYCRRNFGFALCKDLFDLLKWKEYSKKTNGTIIPILLYKASPRCL